MYDYISNQIAVYKTNKVLVEFRDKLKVASIPNYAHIHADGEQMEGAIKKTSLIGILMKDYSSGTGDKSITVKANVSPEDVKFLYSRINAGFPVVDFKQEKIFGTKDENGYSQVTKLRIARADKDSKGAIRKYPWYIEVENGNGIAVKNANGGTYMKANSFASTAKTYANLSDLDMFKLLGRTDAYIRAWENAIAPSLISTAKKAIQEIQDAQQNVA